MQRLSAFLVTVIKTVLVKAKRLAYHIVKHPLGSLWWAVKMYFALMFFSLFVACSFGAFAQTPAYDPNDFRAANKREQWCGVNYPTICAESPSKAIDLQITKFLQGQTVSTSTTRVTPTVLSKADPSLTDTSISVRITYQSQRSELRKIGIPPVDTWVDFAPTQATHGISAKRKMPDVEFCPPEGAEKYKIGPIEADGEKRCYKPLDNKCFQDPKYSLANQFHFASKDAGKGFVCVVGDNGQKCRWKELDGAKGVFSPDVDSSESCEEQPPSDPMPPPPEPPECAITPTGMKVCKEDPNTKCTANSSNAMSCPPSCGYLNNVFVCFENPDVDPEQPEEPDTPRPPKDDNIENPEKPLQDMLKKDFKDVQRGVETRLDGFAADMANLIKAEKGGNEQLVKNSAQGNKLLNSINQNTADTVEQLKILTEPGDEVEGIEKPEFEDKNDWKSRNFGTVMKAKGDEIMKLPIMTAIDKFFDVSFSGSCPTYSVSVWVFEINIDQFCSQQVQALFPYIKAVVLLMCSFFAIRIALL